ncbi:hypothetical protein [Pedobacter sp. UYP24]
MNASSNSKYRNAKVFDKRMRNIFFSLCLFGALGLHAQELKMLNTAAFKKHQTHNEWNYNDRHGNNVTVRKEGAEYWEEITNENSYFEKRNDYDSKGRLKMEAAYFHGGGNFNAGTWKYYDGNGKLTKTEDHDAPYQKFPWEKVLAYMTTHHIPVIDYATRIYRAQDQTGTYWTISWNTHRAMGNGRGEIVKNIRIDCNTGKAVFLKDTEYAFE